MKPLDLPTASWILLCVALQLANAPAADLLSTDIEYAKVGESSLTLDFYRPENPRPPLIVYVHGGAWRGGSKADMPLSGLVAQGFAVASVNYRLSTEARFPAQAHDIKAAIRFLRATQAELRTDADRIVIAGSSAGGHLAALVGMTNGDREMEGKVGDHLGLSSDVQGIVSYYGPSDLTTILDQGGELPLKLRLPALELLLGGAPADKPDLARLASPVFHIDANDPPLLLIHGDADPQTPPEQSKELAIAYQRAGRSVKLVMIHGAAHGGEPFYNTKRLGLMRDFLENIPAN